MKLFRNYKPHPVVNAVLAVLHLIGAVLWSILAGRSFSDGEPIEGTLSLAIGILNLLCGTFKTIETAAGIALKEKKAKSA